MRSLRQILSIGLAAATLAVVLTYMLGAQALLQTPQAEEGHNLFMSMFKPMIQAITGGHRSMAQIHGGSPASEEASKMQEMSESQMQGGMNQGLIGNNVLGSPATLPAGGLAVIVATSAIVLAAAAFVVSWRQRSFLVAGLLAASGIILMILPLANMNFVIPGPIIGVIVGLVILGLGVAKGIRTATALTVAPK
jgi:ABC-type antimicrobial peptide transport system permease subunit